MKKRIRCFAVYVLLWIGRKCAAASKRIMQWQSNADEKRLLRAFDRLEKKGEIKLVEAPDASQEAISPSGDNSVKGL